MPIQIADAYSESLFAKRQTGLLFNLPVPDPDHEQLPAGVSLCMIVKNEERFLDACLTSVKDCVDEICIVDTGSTDRTVEIARAHGAKVIFREWRNDFAWARNESLQMATRRWTLVLDGDEELTPDSVTLVRSVGQTPAALTALYVNIINIVDDPMGAGTMSHRLVRLFPTNERLRYANVIHESLSLVGGDIDLVLSPISLLHKGYTAHMLESREKNARNYPLLQRAYDEHGDDPFSLFNFGNAAVCAGNYDTGIEVLERMLAMPIEPKMYFPIAYVMLCQAYWEGKRDYPAALAAVEAGIARFPADAGLVFMRGQVRSRMNRFEDARADFHQVIQMRDDQRSAVMTDEEIFEWKVYYAMSGTYEREERFTDALECLQPALANKPKSAPLLRTAALMNERLERFHDAEVLFRRCAEADPVAGLAELINFLLRRRRFGQAIEMVESVADRVHPDLLVQLNVIAARAMVEYQAGDPVPFLETALRHAPGNGTALALYEEVLQAREDVDGLASLHRKELEAPLVQVGDYVRRAFRLLSLGRPADAWAAAEAGLAIAPRDPRLSFNGALALVRLGRDAEAIERLTAIPDDAADVFPDAMQMRAALMLKHGDRTGALASLRAWAHARNDDANCYVSGARWLAQNGAHEEAQTLLRDRADDDRLVAAELASMLLATGDLAGAGAVAERALR